jgi:hypothetical protein
MINLKEQPMSQMVYVSKMPKLHSLIVSIRKYLIILIAGKDSVVLNVDITLRQVNESILHATKGMALIGGNCNFDSSIKITTNGGNISESDYRLLVV